MGHLPKLVSKPLKGFVMPKQGVYLCIHLEACFKYLQWKTNYLLETLIYVPDVRAHLSYRINLVSTISYDRCK